LMLNDDLPFKDGASLKKSFGLQRDDKVDIKYIPDIERKLKNKYQIHVSGDHTYTSGVNSLLCIYLYLIDEHYTIDNESRSWKFNKVSFKEKIPLIFNSQINDQINCYDPIEKKERILTHDEIQFIRKNPKQTKYILVPTTQPEYFKQYNEFVRNADLLKKLTKGVINLYKTGTTSNTALNIFDKFTKYINPDSLLNNEASIIKAGSMGALINKEVYKGVLYKYDVCSQLPYLLSSNYNTYPIKRGTFTTINDEYLEQENIEYGLYHVNITSPEDPSIAMFWRSNSEN